MSSQRSRLRPRGRTVVVSALLGALFLPGLSSSSTAVADSALTLHLRKRVETKPGSGRYHTLTEAASWDAKKTAVVICDMWDNHYCPDSARRVGEMAPRMNEVVSALREKGVLVIHCPSDTMEMYRDTPQRELARSAPRVEPKRPLERWCSLDEAREGKLPIDDSDGGCDSVPVPKAVKVFTRQHAAIEIKAPDAITDSPEAYYLMRARGIENLLVMGVHTNMCVLGRPFSIRQMVSQGLNVALVRDMTDTMYNPAKHPFVHHCTGTDLVVEHIEKHWCPTVTSVDFVGGREFRFPQDKRPHVVFVVGEEEYKTEQTLPAFAAQHLGKEFRTSFVFARESDPNDFPGMNAVDEADVLFVSVRRRTPPARDLERIRAFAAAGKPLLGIRTASHAFSLRHNAPVSEGHSSWPTFDPDVWGGHYTNHHGEGAKTAVSSPPGASQQPILTGIDLQAITGNGSLYKVSPLAASATPVLIGNIPGEPSEPIAWTNARPSGGKSFYTSLGHPDDFRQPAFNQLLLNAIRWAAK